MTELDDTELSQRVQFRLHMHILWHVYPIAFSELLVPLKNVSAQFTFLLRLPRRCLYSFEGIIEKYTPAPFLTLWNICNTSLIVDSAFFNIRKMLFMIFMKGNTWSGEKNVLPCYEADTVFKCFRTFHVDVGAFVFMLRVSSLRTYEMPFVYFVWC